MTVLIKLAVCLMESACFRWRLVIAALNPWARAIEARPTSSPPNGISRICCTRVTLQRSAVRRYRRSMCVITSGSPCQDLSQIGTRKRFQAGKNPACSITCELSREMRYATNGLYPAFQVFGKTRWWERFSNDRMDFVTCQCVHRCRGFSASWTGTPEWCEGDALIPFGDCWTPSIREPALNQRRRKRVFVGGGILQATACRRSNIKPRTMFLFLFFFRLYLAGCLATQRGGVLTKQGGRWYPLSDHCFLRRMRTGGTGRRSKGFCAAWTRRRTVPNSALRAVTARRFRFGTR